VVQLYKHPLKVGADFSGAVYQIIDGAGLVSSSQQIDLTQASNYAGFVAQLDVTMSSDLEASIISSSISQSVSFYQIHLIQYHLLLMEILVQ